MDRQRNKKKGVTRKVKRKGGMGIEVMGEMRKAERSTRE